MIFNDISQSLAILIKMLGDCFDDTLQDFLLELLEKSKGCEKNDPTKSQYRPHYVAAYYLKTFTPRDGAIRFTGTDTIEFEPLENQIQRFLDIQAIHDKNLNCISDEFLTETLKNPHAHELSSFIC